jgi:hypothetical protein
MQGAGGVILVAVVVIGFAAVIFWAAVIQPRGEESQAAASLRDLWKGCGLEELPSGEYSLYQIVPTEHWTRSEFVVEDENHQEFGRYIGNDKMSATLTWGNDKADLYVQHASLGGSIYKGKVGGTSDDSIVISSGTRLIAEVWRESAMPKMHYRFAYEGETYLIDIGAFPLNEGVITENGRQLACFRRPRIGARNILVGFYNGLSDELKMCFSAILLLQ